MSFAAPIWLLVLALIPLALIAQRASAGRARKHAIRHPAVATLMVAAGTTSTYRRHLPAAAVLAAIAALALTLARPQHTVHVPIGAASLVLVTDHSGSMAATDVQPTRLGAAVRAADTFIGELPSTVRLGAVTFSTVPDAEQAPVADHAAAREVIHGQQADGGTDTGDALQAALTLLHATDKRHPPSAIVLLSDGSANLGPNPIGVAQIAKQERIPIYTVALGTPNGVLNAGPFNQAVPVPPDPELMSQIASLSGARSFSAQSADQLSSIYQALGNKLTTVARQREITPAFAIAAGVLVLAALGLATIRAERLA